MELDQLAGFVPPVAQVLASEEEVQDVAKALRRRADADAADDIIPRDTEDAYDECFPGYGGFSGAVVDSDEEDLSHMDGVKEAGRSRKDFETQEQWEVRLVCTPLPFHSPLLQGSSFVSNCGRHSACVRLAATRMSARTLRTDSRG